MQILEAIHGRRTIHRFQPDPVPREVLDEMLAAAVMAPNHKLTEPWRFSVVTGETKERLARLRQQVKRAGALQALLGMPAAEEIVGVVFVGYPVEVPAVRRT